MQSDEFSCSARSRSKHTCLWVPLLAGLFLFTFNLWAGPNTTTVTDVIYRADGSPAAGTLLGLFFNRRRVWQWKKAVPNGIY
jgi:hypothetical protein